VVSEYKGIEIQSSTTIMLCAVHVYMYVWPSCVVTTVVSAVGEHIPTYTGS